MLIKSETLLRRYKTKFLTFAINLYLSVHWTEITSLFFPRTPVIYFIAIPVQGQGEARST